MRPSGRWKAQSSKQKLRREEQYERSCGRINPLSYDRFLPSLSAIVVNSVAKEEVAYLVVD